MTDITLQAWPFDRESALRPPVEHEQRRQTQPFGQVQIWDGSPAWLATRYDDVRTILGDPRFSSNPHMPGLMPAPSEAALSFWLKKGTFDKLDPPQHDEERRMVMREFLVRRVQQYRPFLEAVTDELLDKMAAADQPVDIVAAIANPVPARLTCEMMGLPPEDAAYLRERLSMFMSQASSADESTQAMTDLIDYFDGVIAAREATPGDDLVSRLVADHLETGHLDREGARRMLLDLLIGGLDTTSSMIALGTVLFLENPEQLQIMLTQPELWPNAVEEMLRYLTIAQFIGSRTVIDEVEIGGQVLAAGEGAIASLLAANWDPEVFEDPSRFDVQRQARGHVAFGFGVHQCLGQALARLELQIVMQRMFERFPQMSLVTTSADLVFNRTTIHTAEQVLVDVDGPVA
jgi:cytochrome P450